MTDVRLTALNPEDSQVYPVACNSSGELLVSKSDGSYVLKSGDTMTGALDITASESGPSAINLQPDGSATFAKTVKSNGAIIAAGSVTKAEISADGTATFAGSVNSGSIGYASNCFEGLNDGSKSVYFGQASSASAKIFSGTQAGSGVSSTFDIFANGDAVFGNPAQAAGINGIAMAGSSGSYTVGTTKGSQDCIAIFDNSGGGSSKSVSISGNGNAIFTGNISAANINNFRIRLLEAAQSSGSHEDLKNAIVTALAEL